MVDYSKWAKIVSSPSSASDDEKQEDGSSKNVEQFGGRSSTPTSPLSSDVSDAKLSQGLPRQHVGAVVFLHGSGDTGEGIREWLASVSKGKFEQVLSSDLGLRMVYPTAPSIPYTLAGGAPSTVWFDRVGLSPSCPEDSEGISRSLQQVEDEVRRMEDEGLPRSAVFVGGFSMGGSLALQALSQEAFAGRLAGIFSHASFLSNDSPIFGMAHVPCTPLYMSHGNVDDLVETSWGRSTAQRLQGIRGLENLTYTEHEGVAHELDSTQVAGLLDWISAAVRRPAFGHPANADDSTGNKDSCSPRLAKEPTAASSKGAGSAGAQERPCSVAYEIRDLGECKCRASFEVPPGSEQLLSGATICARGGFFQLENLGTPGRVETCFVSPKPGLTAEAIARRIEQRLVDPRPPGMEEACCLS